MDREAEQGHRRVHGIFPPNYVTLQQLKQKKELQKEEEEKKKRRQEEEKEKEVQRQKKEEEEKKKQQEQERRKLKEPSLRLRSSLPPNYVTLQQLKERKEQNLQREEEHGRNKPEEEEKNKLQEQSLRPWRNGSGSGNREPPDSGLETSTREDSEKKNLQQAAKNGCRGTTESGVAKDDRGPSGRWGRQGDQKTFTGSALRNPAHREKNGEAPSDVHPEDATVNPCVEKVWQGKANIGEESSMKISRDSEIPRAKGNGDTDLPNTANSATGKIARLASKGELVNTKAVGLVAEGTSATAEAVTVAPEETKAEENKNEKGKERKRPFRKRTKKKPQNQAQASEDSANTATVDGKATALVPVIQNVPAGEDRGGDYERRRASEKEKETEKEKEKEKEGEGSVRDLQKHLARKIVLAASTNERQRRSWGRDSEKRASVTCVKKGETPSK